jgi:hypothetical protein
MSTPLPREEAAAQFSSAREGSVCAGVELAPQMDEARARWRKGRRLLHRWDKRACLDALDLLLRLVRRRRLELRFRRRR